MIKIIEFFYLHMTPNICNYSIKDFLFLINKKSIYIFEFQSIKV
jgi:hypothetical protein